MKRHCGRPIGGRGEGYAKSGQMRTRGREGVKNGTFVRTSFMDGPQGPLIEPELCHQTFLKGKVVINYL